MKLLFYIYKFYQNLFDSDYKYDWFANKTKNFVSLTYILSNIEIRSAVFAMNEPQTHVHTPKLVITGVGCESDFNFSFLFSTQ